MSPTLAPSIRHVEPDELELRRVRRGRGFSYHRPDGARVDDPIELERIRALAIPPAWTDVRVSDLPESHLQAVGRDARGRTQYRYHPEWRAFRDRVKFDRLLVFGEALPDVRTRIDHDLSRSGVPRDKVVATVVALLQATLIRVGNEKYAREERRVRADHVPQPTRQGVGRRDAIRVHGQERPPSRGPLP